MLYRDGYKIVLDIVRPCESRILFVPLHSSDSRLCAGCRRQVSHSLELTECLQAGLVGCVGICNTGGIACREAYATKFHTNLLRRDQPYLEVVVWGPCGTTFLPALRAFQRDTQAAHGNCLDRAWCCTVM